MVFSLHSLYMRNALSTTEIHCTFILISSTRHKSNLEAVFQPRAGKQDPFWFQKEQFNIHVHLIAVCRVLVLVYHLNVTTNESRATAERLWASSLSAQSNNRTDSNKFINTAPVNTIQWSTSQEVWYYRSPNIIGQHRHQKFILENIGIRDKTSLIFSKT